MKVAVLKSNRLIWKNKLENYRNFYKIGINPKSNNNSRSFPLELFKNICKFKKIKLFNLQKNISNHDFLKHKIEVLSFDNFDQNELFQDSKALIENLDLVITCDTSIAHLAASMHKPTWVLLNDVPDWRWFLNSSKSLWYKNILLFRCEKILIIIFSLIFSIFKINNDINKFDKYFTYNDGESYHAIIRSPPEMKIWKRAAEFKKEFDLKNPHPYEYRHHFLPPKILGFFGKITNMKFYDDESEKIFSSGNKFC